MGHVKVMMVKHDKREIEQLRGIFESDTYYEYAGCLEKGEHAVQKIADEKPDIVVVDEVVAGTDIMDIVESTSKNRNLKNVINNEVPRKQKCCQGTDQCENCTGSS